MSFASSAFFVFFVVVVCVTAWLERAFSSRTKEIFLVFASYFFYGYWDWRFCFLLLFVTVVSYLTALFHEKKLIYILGVITPLLVLGFFKYFNFFLESASKLIGKELGSLAIILPVGISFYTFQALSYVIDVHRGKIAAEEDFIKIALYICFFPQLVAGPIVKAADFLPQLKCNSKVSFENIRWGVQVFAFGLFKKVVLADHIAVFVDDVYSKPHAYHWTTILLAVLSYSLQIYFDFSGYSDMAIGSAKCLGYNFNMNFNLPYVSSSITEFWRRWHISLSTWLKEYLYIPLGGNRQGRKRQYVNLFVTMLLGGLWHGANWTYVFWGGVNGLALCIDKLLKSRRLSLQKTLKCIGIFIFVSFSWIFFRSDSFAVALSIVKGIVSLQNGIKQPYVWSCISMFALVIGTQLAFVKSRKKDTMINGFYPVLNLNSVFGLTIFLVEIGLIIGLAYTGENPFVYFQF